MGNEIAPKIDDGDKFDFMNDSMEEDGAAPNHSEGKGPIFEENEYEEIQGINRPTPKVDYSSAYYHRQKEMNQGK